MDNKNNRIKRLLIDKQASEPLFLLYVFFYGETGYTHTDNLYQTINTANTITRLTALTPLKSTNIILDRAPTEKKEETDITRNGTP